VLAAAILVPSVAGAQELNVHPFVQHVSPTSAWIVWETTTGEQSRVDWGRSTALTNTSTGTSRTGALRSRIHETPLDGLTPGSKYFYRVVTGSLVSDTFWFYSAPDPADEASFRVALMSDMQIDRSNRSVYGDIVTDGVIATVQSQWGQDLAEELAFVMVPGDLVENGWSYNQWRDDFFNPGRELMKHVPFYPVPGNHEANTPTFFKYFHLPDNGSAGFEEHWWFHDYSNVRVIGLDSNGIYRNATQLAWLDDTLAEACMLDDIDFVFAQLHHPHRSELWVAGEIDYTGQVIDRLETFSTDCGKPSVHFFGHTHGYSRGQSRDHAHTMVNVATSGGNIDYWGEYEQRDYPEYTVTQDEWGFMLAEVTAGAAPEFRLKRYSRGNENMSRDNEVRDEVHVRRYNGAPDAPVPVAPVGMDVNPDCFTLATGPFSDPDGDAHGATQWQLASTCSNFDTPMLDRWIQHENQFGGSDLQAGDDLTDEVVEGLAANTAYCWRARFRDRSLGWSEWSTSTSFTTGAARSTGNLLDNPGAEDGTSGWTEDTGNFESVTDGQCDGAAPHRGQRYFAVGGICRAAASATAHQTVDVSMHGAAIDGSGVRARFGGWLRNFNGNDHPELSITFEDGNGAELMSSPWLGTLASQWTRTASTVAVPSGTRAITMRLKGTRNNGNDNDSYFDDLWLRLLLMGAACDERPDPVPPLPMDAGVSADAGAEDAGFADAGVTLDASAPDVTIEDAAPAADASVAADASAPDAVAAVDGGMLPEAEEGCGCATSRRDAPTWPALALLVLPLLRRRRAS